MRHEFVVIIKADSNYATKNTTGGIDGCLLHFVIKYQESFKITIFFSFYHVFPRLIIIMSINVKEKNP